ncbi:2-hydroxyacid dehydrogenase [Ohtaekwangia kribbensis]|jgi:D-lactate dehydrogenase|uniref:2-hydroxyacid dehydrogenase n=1 Tax=Ohtaekwangia kribbensis TaxID=688913 RepID=A0ABW3K5Y8_9BACT
MKTFVYSAHAYDRPFLEQAARKRHELVFTEEKLTLATAHYASGFDAIAVFTADDCSAPVLDKLYTQGIRYIALRSAGYDHIDLHHAATLGIRVSHVPEYSPYSIAEHAVAMLMMMNRNLLEAQRLMKLQDFRLDTLTGFDIHGKTVGIIGTGKIGIAFARIMKGFGATVLACDPVQHAEAVALGVQYVSLEELLRGSDIVSLHCPLNETTRYLLSAKQFEWMKDDSILINTSRGAIVHTKDLIQALEDKKLGGACLDVYEREKGLFFEDHRHAVIQDEDFLKLRSMKNVLLTGHQAFLTREALTGIAETTIQNLDYWQLGYKSPYELHADETFRGSSARASAKDSGSITVLSI